MTHQTYLGFDYGQKFLGLAVGQSITMTANPLTTLPMQKGKPNWPLIDDIVAQWRPHAFVVGLALQPDGGDSKTSKLAKSFGETLRQRYQKPTYYIDERLTSVAARESLGIRSFPTAKQKLEIDRISAAIILESWLNRASNPGG